jgi:hypothetical protein
MIDPSLFIDGLNYNQMPDHEDVPNNVPLTCGTLWIFKKAGVAIKDHEHAEDKAHISVCLKGSFEVQKGEEKITLNEADVMNFPAGVSHTITSQGEAMLLNVHTYGNSLESFEARLGSLKAMFQAHAQEFMNSHAEFKKQFDNGGGSLRSWLQKAWGGKS